MDDDELLAEWTEFVVGYGSSEAGALAIEGDAQWSEIDADELDELLVGFADDQGVHAAVRVASLIFSGEE